MDKSPPDLSRCGHRKCKDIVDQYCMAFYNVLYSLRNSLGGASAPSPHT